MPVSVVVGGQFGSEGKGKVAHYFAKELQAKAVVRVGGPNSGHTVIDEQGNAVIFKHLPTACIIKSVKSVIPAGSYLNLEILFKEISMSGISKEDLIIDPFAMIIGEEDLQTEKDWGLMSEIGSTGSGLGSALRRRISRDKKVVFAKDISDLEDFVSPTSAYLRYLLDENERVIIEGTQGFGLSLLHSGYYPFVTSRDTSAAAFISEAGLSPFDVDDIILVLRAFPIRVGGKSGPLPKETTWDEISNQAGSNAPIIEYTSVTQKVRRVALFDEEVVIRAIEYNRPTRIILNHIDYIDASYEKSNAISDRAYNFIATIESLINAKIDFIGGNRKSLTQLHNFKLNRLLNQVIK